MELPPDVLRSILQRLFPLGPPEPLQEVARRWLTLHSVSHAWAAALEAEPPIQVSVKVDIPPAGSIAWLQPRAAVLRIAPGNRPAFWDWDEYQADTDACESFYWRLATGGPLHGEEQPNEPLPLNLSACRQLQELSIDCFDYSRNEGPQPHFDTAPLAQLPHLERLELNGFSSFDLRGLPPSLRCLRAVGDAGWADEFPAAEAWGIPEACRLDSVSVLFNKSDWDFSGQSEEESVTCSWVLRLPLPHIWRGCRSLELDSEFLLFGDAPGENAQIVLPSDNIAPLLDILLAAMSGASPLCRLAMDPESWLAVTHGGQVLMIHAGELASEAGQQRLVAHPAGTVLSVAVLDSEELLLQNALQKATRQPRRQAPRVVVTSAAPPA